MGRRKSEATKQACGMGTGHGKDYLPYITTGEFNSQGTTSIIRDWKTGREVHCLSQGEALWYYILRWDDGNIDIREQFPLEREETVRIAQKNGWKHPVSDQHTITTDFLVTKADHTMHAYSVKESRDLSPRTLELLAIEKIYWNSQGVPFQMLFKTDVNKTLANNIRRVVEFYDATKVFDVASALKHKIAIKEYPFDLENELLTEDRLFQLLGVKHE